MRNNIVSWVEIPVKQMARAINFYETVFSVGLEKNRGREFDMAWFPYSEGKYGSGAALVLHKEFYQPSSNGVVVYLSSPADDVNVELERVVDAGGKILQRKNKISDEYGYLAVILDTEGNRVALHSRE
ncbi:VOC family protein [uncultured Draconibacterium sp.]|uniref:VOC family protein n=1 Tax=uncultured Draconibacterium sp. TaxID=1573823 RepID=UPI0029C7B924|nr:VOC family protein [uncultured Draconibacterium sp.]